MSIGKKDYPKDNFKRAVRHEVIPHHKFRTLVTCLGPSPEVSVREAMNKGYYNIISYELDKKTLIDQDKAIREFELNPNVNITLVPGDILQANVKNGIYYDLDFCGFITQFKEHVKKFKNNSTFTFCLRDGNKTGKHKERTIKTFFELRNEIIEDRYDVDDKRIYIDTTEGKYLLLSYRDGAPMLTITKIKKTKNEIA